VLPPADPARLEALGPAERVLQTLLTWTDHLVHHRPGLVTQDRALPTGIRWVPVTSATEGADTVVYQLVQQGKARTKVRLGVRSADGTVRDGRKLAGVYRAPGLAPEVAGYLYRQVADVWKLDQEFAARWGSWAFGQENRDLKVVLAAFLLVQSRSGEPVRGEDGGVLFFDDDHRDVGEAMCLLVKGDKKDLNPKLLLRVGEVLEQPPVAAINRELGFGKSLRAPALGRWPKAVEKWLRYRERNPRMLQGLVKAGFRTTVIELARKVGYKPESEQFFQVLRWKQKQAKDGRRGVAIGMELRAAESWAGLTETEICERIVATKPDLKRLVGLLPKEPGLTAAIVAAAIEAGSLSDTDLLLYTPTLEELGLLEVPALRARWEAATKRTENQRASNVAARVRSESTAAVLRDAADNAVKTALSEVTKDLRVYVMVDKSGSMEGAIERAKVYLARFLQGFPLERLHVAVFNTVGAEVTIKHASAAGVEHAFKGHTAGGGTVYGAGVRALQHLKPKSGEDVLFLFVGDQADGRGSFVQPVRDSGLNPLAFGLLEVVGSWGTKGTAVEETAKQLGIPCFRIDEGMFGDTYAVTRVLRDLVAATPVGQRAVGPSLVEVILGAPLLQKPAWAGR
jgi:hypothetical protein